MNFWGRILLVLNVILSFTFLAYAASVFNVQKSWREKSEANAEIVKQKDSQLTNLTQEFDNFKNDTAKQIAEMTDERDTATNSRNQLQTALETLTKQMETTQTELEREKALSQISGEETEARKAEALKERAANVALHKTIVAHMKKIHELEDQIYENGIERQNLIVTHEMVLSELADAKKVIRYKGIDKEETKDILVRQSPPPTVEGVVLSTRADSRNGLQYVEISVGSDDGLVKGHELFGYRFATSVEDRPKYLNTIRLIRVDPDKSVGVVIPKSKNGEIKKGDNVSTKL
ncbi:MAG: hypothetical protein O2955_09425 [Planctomycetota bacterium]|nr:hypothetical protein [Planctomycetota bacterium]MDA1212729.1 hypothetical protein [Planctomycetota bacterium]